MAQRVFVDPRKYAVGIDIPEQTYQDALLRIADWFAESRKTKEPALLAKQLFQCCLDGVTRDGKPWFAAATASLAARVRSMCRFDIEKMEPLRNASEKTRKKKDKERVRKERKRKDALQDPLIPDEVRADLRKSAKYGDNPHVFLSTEEEKNWRAMYDAYQQQFPELRTVNAEAELKSLCDLHTLSDRYRLKLLQGQVVSIEERAAVGDELQKIKKALGIHPDQLAKRSKTREDTSIGSAAARLDALNNWRELRARFWVEELLQIFQMYQSVTADGTGYQLDEIGLYGMTKCRTCACAKCGHRNYAGMSIEEIEQWLIQKGVLKPVEEVHAEDSATVPAQ